MKYIILTRNLRTCTKYKEYFCQKCLRQKRCFSKSSDDATDLIEDPYDVLGVSRNASLDEIKQAHRKMALDHHHIRTRGDPQSQEIFTKANNAYRSIIETRHKEGALIKTEDVGSLMPYDFSLKPTKVEDVPRETFWDKTMPKLWQIPLLIILYFVIKHMRGVEPEEYEDFVKRVPQTKKEIAEEIRADLYRTLEEEKNIRELKEKLGKSLSSVMQK